MADGNSTCNVGVAPLAVCFFGQVSDLLGFRHCLGLGLAERRLSVPHTVASKLTSQGWPQYAVLHSSLVLQTMPCSSSGSLFRQPMSPGEALCLLCWVSMSLGRQAHVAGEVGLESR